MDLSGITARYLVEKRGGPPYHPRGTIPECPVTRRSATSSDPDSRIMPGPGGRDFQQSYNCWAVVDSIHQVVVAARALNLSPDKQQAVATVEDAIGDVGAVPKEVSAAAGCYWAKADLKALGVEPFIEPEKTCCGTRSEQAPREPYTEWPVSPGPDETEAADDTGRQPYALRIEMAVPVFGQI